MRTYLAHHSIMGMKWGVRRWQNPDGSLTEAGRLRYDKVAGSARLTERQTKQALAKLDDDAGLASKKADFYDKRASKLKKKASKYARKASLARGEAIANRIVHDKSLSTRQKITSGEWQAGRDFIVQNDYNIWAIPGAGFVYVDVSVDRRLITKNQ